MACFSLWMVLLRNEWNKPSMVCTVVPVGKRPRQQGRLGLYGKTLHLNTCYRLWTYLFHDHFQKLIVEVYVRAGSVASVEAKDRPLMSSSEPGTHWLNWLVSQFWVLLFFASQHWEYRHFVQHFIWVQGSEHMSSHLHSRPFTHSPLSTFPAPRYSVFKIVYDIVIWSHVTFHVTNTPWVLEHPPAGYFHNLRVPMLE